MHTISICIHLGERPQCEAPVHVCARKRNIAVLRAETQCRVWVDTTVAAGSVSRPST